MWHQKLQLVPTLAIIAYLALLIFAIYLIAKLYYCDEQTCLVFTNAFKKDTPKTQVLTLLEGLNNTSIWSLAYIASAILSFLILWLINAPITVVNYTITFILGLFVIYMIISYMSHHYLYPIKLYVMEYINSSCPDTITINKDLGITFTETIIN